MAPQSTMVLPTDTTEDFNTRLYNLPQELFGEVFELVISVESDQAIEITNGYKPPKALQLTRAIRKQQALKYYSNNTFLTRVSAKLTKLWYTSLEPEHRTILQGIRLERWEACCRLISRDPDLQGYSDFIPASIFKKMVIQRHLVHLWNFSYVSQMPEDHFKIDCEDQNGNLVWMTSTELRTFMRQL